MDDNEIREHIEQLVAEEHALFERHGDGSGLAADEHRRLESLTIELDRLWDLLRQRRALRRAGLDPEIAQERDASTVEDYLQ
jgi:hypothetical protein